jgi:hypothetical protein
VERGRKGKKKEGGRNSSELLSHGRFDKGGFRRGVSERRAEKSKVT